MKEGTMKLVEVKSKFIKGIAYDELTKHLMVKIGEKLYNHYEVPPEVHKALMESESKGKYYNQKVRGKYD